MRINVTADAVFRKELLDLVRNNIKPAVQEIVDNWLPGQLERVLDNWLAHKPNASYWDRLGAKTNLELITDTLKGKIDIKARDIIPEVRKAMDEVWHAHVADLIHRSVEAKVQNLPNLDEKIRLAVRNELMRLGAQTLQTEQKHSS